MHEIRLTSKVRDYLSGGSQEVWILDHENSEFFIHTIAAIRMPSGKDVPTSPPLPGFAATIEELLAGP